MDSLYIRNYFIIVVTGIFCLLSTNVVTAQTADQAQIGLALYPRTAAEISAGVTPVKMHHPPGYLPRYGSEGDGTTDDSAALQAGLAVANQSGLPLLIPYTSNYYKFDTALTLASLSNPIKIIGEGQPELRYEGSNANYAAQVTDTNGNDFEIDGVIINADQNASIALRVSNRSASMADANIGKAIFRNSVFKDSWMAVGNTYASAGILVVGGFSEMVVENVVVRNIDRATGAGVAGTRGSVGIAATFKDINAYVRKLTVIGGEIDTITNNETTGSAADVDADGIIYSTPSARANGGEHLAASMTLWGTRFKDCKGRCVKTQTDGFTIIRDFTIERGLEEAIKNAVDFDLQRGGGIISGGNYYVYEKSGGGTTLGLSHAIIAWKPDQLATQAPNADGGLRVSDITIYSSIPTSVDTLPYFALLGNDDTTRQLTAFSIKDCVIVGGRISRWLKATGQTEQELNITLEGIEGDTTTSLIQFRAAVGSNVHLVVNKNRNFGTITTPDLIELATSGEPRVSGYDNTGWNTSYLGTSQSNKLAEIFRPTLIGGDSTNSHVLATAQTVTLADDAEHAFGSTGTYGVGIITNNFSQASQAVFSHASNAFTEYYQDGATSALLTFGTVANPDVDGDINIWITGNDTINVKNRLGSQQVFHFWHFGGD
jgi:hypothetical protein